MFTSKSEGEKEKKSCVSYAYRWWFNDRDEIRVLRGVVYDKEKWTKNRALRNTTETGVRGGQI